MERHHPGNNDSDSDSDTDTEVRCISCRDMYIPDVARNPCQECCDGAAEAHENLLEKIHALKAKVDFLRLSSSLDHGSNSKSFTDVVFIVFDAAGTPPIPAHKAVLVNRSPVFKARFENEMEESRTIKIGGVSYGALRAFVNYLYTAEAILDEQIALDLLNLSDKYQVLQLKNYCEKFLLSNLSLKKSLVGYAFANHYNLKQLRDVALAKMIDNVEKITKGQDYLEIVEEYPHLIITIYEAYLAKEAAGTSTSNTG